MNLDLHCFRRAREKNKSHVSSLVIISISRNFPNYYYKVNYTIPGGKTLDIIMLDTIQLCGNTKSDFAEGQPQGPTDFLMADSQWTWLEQQLATSKYVAEGFVCLF